MAHHPALLQPDAAYRALQTRDARFDGRLFVGVTSTGIYCRPVCRVRPPRRENCRFFANAASAELQGFRPCLRCRPELAPGLSLMDSSSALAQQAALRLGQAARLGEALPLPRLAAQLGVTDRHLRRIFAQVHGVSPLAYLVTQRLLLAKHLLTDTALPVTDVALATGFGSLRRFNAAFVANYRMNPTSLRKARPDATPAAPAGRLGPARSGGTNSTAASGAAAIAAAGADTVLRLAWRPPYDVAGVLAFLAKRAIPGVERVDGLSWQRTLALPWRGQVLSGWLSGRFVPERHELALSVSPGLLPVLGLLLERTRQALDLDAEPALIDPVLADIGTEPGQGTRLIGGLDGFEIAARVVIGQQVTVAAARTLTLRLVERFGAPLDTPVPGLNRLFPSAQAIAQASAEDIGTLGIVRQRTRALQALATEIAAGRLQLHRSAPLAPTLAALMALPGIGDWSAQLIAMRALCWPDAWPATDIAILNALLPHTGGQRSAPLAQAHAERWRPWRAYAVMRLWQTLEAAPTPPTSTSAAPTPRARPQPAHPAAAMGSVPASTGAAHATPATHPDGLAATELQPDPTP